MIIENKLRPEFLGQVMPANPSPELLFSPPAKRVAIVEWLIVCNTDSLSAHLIDVFYNPTGNRFLPNNAIFMGYSLQASETKVFELYLPFPKDGSGTLVVGADTINTVTFTATGRMS